MTGLAYNIRLGENAWCTIKTTVVDDKKVDRPEFLVHLAYGHVQAKGVQLDDDGKQVLFVEIAGQRILASHVFRTEAEAIEQAGRMMDEQREGLKAVPLDA